MINQRDINKQIVVGSIINELSKKSMSIAEISRKLNIKRSTLNYHLSNMQIDGIIKRRTEENKTGSPSVISLTTNFKNKRNAESTNLNKNYIKILKKLEEIGNPVNINDYFNLIITPEDKNIDEKTEALSRILSTYPPLVESAYRITPDGKKFLKEYSK